MRVLIGCEESQAICKAFREKGHEAYSCDIQECSGGHPEWHIIGDILEVIKGGWFVTQSGTRIYIDKWDMAIFHPPCTFLSRAGQAHKSRSEEIRKYREEQAALAIEFIKKLWDSPIPKICIENPVGVANTRWRKPSQIVHPYYFGDGEMKETCFWIKGLPRLNGDPNIDKIRDKPKPTRTRIGADGKVKNEYFCYRMDRKSNAAKLKSKTFPGIAKAMADQWG